MSAKAILKTHFSDFFDVPKQSLEKAGAFNVSLINDLPLFIDPFLLFNSKKQQYRELHDEIIRYLRFLRDKSAAGSLPPGLIGAWYAFPEIKQTWLGFSKVGNAGHGRGESSSPRCYSHRTSSLVPMPCRCHEWIRPGTLDLTSRPILTARGAGSCQRKTPRVDHPDTSAAPSSRSASSCNLAIPASRAKASASCSSATARSRSPGPPRARSTAAYWARV